MSRTQAMARAVSAVLSAALALTGGVVGATPAQAADTCTAASATFDGYGCLTVAIPDVPEKSDPYAADPAFPSGTALDATVTYDLADPTMEARVWLILQKHDGNFFSTVSTMDDQTAIGSVTASGSTGALTAGSHRIQWIIYVDNPPNDPITDSWGNGWRTFDVLAGTAPTVTVEQAAGQPDPASGATVAFTATFSEAVTGLTAGDVTVSGTAGASTVAISGGPAVYTITVGGMTQSGTVVAAIPAGSATAVSGGLGNTTSTRTDNTVTWTMADAAPTVTVEQAAGQSDPASGATVAFTATFSEAVTGLTAGDIAISGTAGPSTVSITGGPTVYTITVGGMAQSGTVVASIPADSAVDANAQGNTASTSADNSVEWNAVPSQPVPDPVPVVTGTSAGTSAGPSGPTSPEVAVVEEQPVANAVPAQVAGPAPQTALLRIPKSRMLRTGASVVLTRRPVTTNAGVTVRWRVSAGSLGVCAVSRMSGRVTLTALKRGRCAVQAWAPAPSAAWSPFLGTVVFRQR